MTRRRKKNKKWIFRILFLVLMIAAGVVVYFVWDGYFRDKNDETKPVPASSEVVEDEKKENAMETEVTSEVVEKEKVKQYEGEDPNVAEELTGVITYAGVSGENLMIRINIDQYLGVGNCNLSLRKNGTEVYSEAAGIVVSASTSTCEGFNVSTRNLEKGEYEIVIRLSSEERAGTISGKVNI